MNEEECGEVYSPGDESKDGAMEMIGFCMLGAFLMVIGIGIGWWLRGFVH